MHKALFVFDTQITEELIETLIVLPLETGRLKHRHKMALDKLKSYQQFYAYHLRDFADQKGEISRRVSVFASQVYDRNSALT